jgi:hypothetical protein
MGALGAVVLALASRRWREIAIAAAIAIAIALPAALLQGDRLEGDSHRSGAPAERHEPHWRVNPHRGADLASFVVPGPDPVDDDALIRLHPAYVGLSVLILAGLAARRREVGPWTAIAVVALVLAPGPQLRIAGDAVASNPVVAAASSLPLVGLVNHWGRLWLLGQVGLAALASAGAAGRRWVVILVAAEYGLLSPAPFPLPVASADVAAIDRSLDDLPPGAVVVVPSAGPRVAFQRLLYRQRGHERVLCAHPNRPGYGPVEDVALVRWFAGLPGERRDPPDPDVDASLRELRRRGVGVIVVDEPYVDDVVVVLGPPDVRVSEGAAWAVGP